MKKSQINLSTGQIHKPTEVLWDVGSITSETLFIFDFKANKALGCFERDRLLTNQHPELIRYLLDAQDKDWLIQNRILSPTYRGFRILLLVLDEVHKIAQSDQYRKRVNMRFNELSGFKVPGFVLHKMRSFFNELSEKSKCLLENANSMITTITKPKILTSTTVASTIKTVSAIKPILVRIFLGKRRKLIQEIKFFKIFSLHRDHK